MFEEAAPHSGLHRHVVNVGKNARRLRPAGWKTPQFSPRAQSRAFQFTNDIKLTVNE